MTTMATMANIRYRRPIIRSQQGNHQQDGVQVVEDGEHLILR